MNIDTTLILDEILKSKAELLNKIEASEVNLLLKIEGINRKTIEIEKENKYLREKVEHLERKSRKNNIVIFGIKHQQATNILDCTLAKLQELLGVEIEITDINNIYQLGRGTGPIIIEFLSYLKKKEIFQNLQKLKGSNVYVNNDLTLLERQKLKILREHLKLRRENGESDCYIKGEKLFVNKKAYTVDELIATDQEIELSPRKINSAPSTPTVTERRHLTKVLLDTEETPITSSEKINLTKDLIDKEKTPIKEDSNPRSTQTKHKTPITLVNKKPGTIEVINNPSKSKVASIILTKNKPPDANKYRTRSVNKPDPEKLNNAKL